MLFRTFALKIMLNYRRKYRYGDCRKHVLNSIYRSVQGTSNYSNQVMSLLKKVLTVLCYYVCYAKTGTPWAQGQKRNIDIWNLARLISRFNYNKLFHENTFFCMFVTEIYELRNSYEIKRERMTSLLNSSSWTTLLEKPRSRGEHTVVYWQEVRNYSRFSNLVQNVFSMFTTVQNLGKPFPVHNYK